MRTRPLAVLIGVVGAALAAFPAAAQIGEDGAIPDAELERVVADLDSDDPTTRELASRSMADDPRLSLRRLERYLTGSTLTREQRRRLMVVAFRRFTDPGSRAAMGVSFERLPRESVLRLAMVVPNFPSAGVLKAGDRVLAFDGVALRDQEHAVAMIIARDPGDEMQVSLQRDGEAMIVPVTLGRRDRLDNPMASPQMLSEAWAIRSRAYTADGEARVIDGGPAPGRDAPQAVDAAVVWAPVENPAVVAGGEARGGIDPALAGREAHRRVDAMIIRQQPNRQGALDAQDPGMQVRVLREDLERRRLDARDLRERLRSRDLPADLRRAYELQVQRVEEVIRERERLLQMLEGPQVRPPR